MNNTTFEQRSFEWDYDRVKGAIGELFQNIDLLENWKFVKITWAKNKRKRKEEIKKSIYRTLKIHVNELTQKKTIKKEHVYTIQVPEILQDQFFYIGGLLKVPVFQLIDEPVIHRSVRNKTILNFKNNVISLRSSIDKDDSFLIKIFLTHMKFYKDIPLENIICAMYKREEFQTFVDSLPNENPVIEQLVARCNVLWKGNKESKLIELLGAYRTSNVAITDNLKKGKSILFAISNSVEIDTFSKKYMKTNSPILELLYSLSEGTKSDTSLENKRIRFSEYVLYNLIRSVFDMICILNDNKRVKFKIPTTILLDSCNVSSIIHHNFPYNPLGEISALTQSTIIGPGSFTKSKTPSHLKNLDPSHYGIFCPADTPDRDGCGVILNFCPGAKIDPDGRMTESDLDMVCSHPITLVPFLSNNDQTRLQMASGQMKQSILLENATKPLIKTGWEDKYFEYTSFKQIAKDDGEVAYKNHEFIVIKYESGSIDIFKLSYRPMYLNSADYMYSDLKVGDKFKKDDVIAISKFFKDGDLTLGHNLTTAVAIWEGYNYEDGIVISEDVVERYTSLHTVELAFEIEGGQILLSLLDDSYKPLPSIGDKLKKGEIYAKLKHIGHDGIESINTESNNMVIPIDCEITSIEIYPNTWNKQIPQFHNFIKTLIKNQNGRLNEIRTQLSEYMSNEKIDNILDFYELSKLHVSDAPPPKKSAKYSEKGKNIEGIKIILKGIHKSKISVGDKVSNRHGAKGIISKIIPKAQMPQLADGRHVEIIVNPLGIISRMNCGQLYELHSTEALYNMKTYLMSDHHKNGKLSDKANKKLQKFLELLDNTDDKIYATATYKRFQNILYEKDICEALDDIQIVQPPFNSITPQQLDQIMKLTGSEYKQFLYIDDKKCFKNPIAVGSIYFQKLIHRSEDKIISRSVGPYVNTTLQPVGGKKLSGGHKLGEMEIWALIAQGAEVTVEEFLTTHSDSPGKKLRVLSDILQNEEILLENDAPDKPRTLSLLNAMFKTIGTDLED